MGENHEGATYVVDRHRRHVTISNAYIGSASSVYNEIQKWEYILMARNLL